MKKYHFRRILSCLLIVSMLLGMVPAALAAEGDATGANLVENGDFETWSQDGAPLYMSPWQVTEDTEADGVRVNDGGKHTGEYGLNIWKSATKDSGDTEIAAVYTVNVYQVISNVPAGTYTLSAYSTNYIFWDADDAYVYYYTGNDNSNSEMLKITANKNGAWEELKRENIEVAEDTTMTIGVYATASWSTQSVYFDDISLVRSMPAEPEPTYLSITEDLIDGVTAAYTYDDGTAAAKDQIPDTAASVTVTLTGFDAEQHTASYSIGSGEPVPIENDTAAIQKPDSGWEAITIAVKEKDGGETPDPDEPDDPPAVKGVQNGSFEDVTWNGSTAMPNVWTLDADTTEGSIFAQWKDSGAAHSGNYVLSAWAGSAFKGGISQEVTGLEPGTYTLSVWAQAGATTAPAASYIYGYGTGQTQQKATIDESRNWAWAETKVGGIVVGEDGKATIGYYVDAYAGYSVNLDDVTLIPAVEEPEEPEDTNIKNPSFEAGERDTTTNHYTLPNWTVVGNGVFGDWKENAYRGDKVLSAYSDAAYSADVYQEITGLEPGYYYLTAYAQSSGGQPLSVIYGYGTGQSRSMTAIPATDGTLLPIKDQWIMVTVRGICVGNDGKATIGFATKAEAGQWASLDFFALKREKIQKPYQLLKGGDTSCVSYEEDFGAKYYDEDGTEGDVYQLLADNGWDIVRLRLYNDPGKGRGNGDYYCLEGYETVEDLLVQAKRAKEKGLQIQFSFHYSDYWTNGGTQIIPAGWQKEIEGMNEAQAVAKLETLVYDYTKEVMQKLADQGTTGSLYFVHSSNPDKPLIS